MATYQRRTVESALETKGFRRRENDHSYFFYHTVDGRKTTVRTRTSHGSSGADLDNSLIGRIARQCKVTVPEFRNFIECALSRTDYEALPATNGQI